MENWEVFEQHATKCLNSKFKKYGLSFKPTGGKDSNTSDILVQISSNDNLFSIEAKLSPAQCGQFVINENGDSFELTNKSRLSNNYTKTIIDHINENLKEYTKNNPKYFDLNCNQKLLYQWIHEHYKNKNSLFFVTSTLTSGYISIISLDSLQKFFNFSARLRVKKSGTRNISKKSSKSILAELDKHLNKLGITKFKYITNGNKTIVRIDGEIKEIDYKNRYFGNNTFLSKEENKSDYSVKIRSSTNNINVVFSIQYIGPKKDYGEEDFLNFLKSNKVI